MGEIKKIGGGLNPTPYDPRDLRLGKIFGYEKPENVPMRDFLIGAALEIKDQGNTDMCTAHGVASASEYQEGVALDPNYQFAKIKQLLGKTDGWGADLRVACKSATKYGSLPKEKSPFSFTEKGRDFVADWKNWPFECDVAAVHHRKAGFYKVDGPYSLFDNIRAALFRHNEEIDENRAIIVGALWRDSWTIAPNGVIPKSYEPNGFGHLFIIVGQKIINYEPYLVIQNSGGKEIGDKGYFYMPKETANREFTRYGAYMFKDLAPEIARENISWLTKTGNYIKWYLGGMPKFRFA